MLSVSMHVFHCCFMCLKSFEPLEPGEKGARGHVRILKPAELRKIKLLGQGAFGSVHKVLDSDSAVCHLHVIYVFNKIILSLFFTFQGIWIPEGDTVKLPVAIKVIQDRTGRQTFNQLTDVREHDFPKTEGSTVFSCFSRSC